MITNEHPTDMQNLISVLNCSHTPYDMNMPDSLRRWQAIKPELGIFKRAANCLEIKNTRIAGTDVFGRRDLISVWLLIATESFWLLVTTSNSQT